MNTELLQSDLLPNGQPFAFWDDTTEYTTVYHVDQNHPQAADDNPGTAALPFRTIGRAAELLQPGEKVVIHAGIYRECVQPVHGGTGPDRMIAYEAAPGETVLLTGTESWLPDVLPSAGWNGPEPADGATIWMAEVPTELFAGYNPFLVRNAYEYFDVYAQLTNKEFVQRAMHRRGMVFYQGEPLQQVYRYAELAKADGTFWVEEPGLRLHFRLPGDLGPADLEFEITVREQVFAPAAGNLGIIRVSGLHCRHAADGLPVPQRALLSTSRGHHWIIEDNEIDWANGVGIDLGAQHWSATIPEVSGGHLVRRNRIRHCGICGIAGALGVHHTLIEDNLIEDIGFHNLERMWECGGLKFHLAEHCLIRRNVFRHLRHAGGIWIDCTNVNNRITNNVFADIEAILGAIYSEMNFDANLIDHNLIWDVRCPEHSGNSSQGAGVKADCNEKLVVAHNFIGKTEGGAIMFTLNQADRRHGGRTGVCRANQSLNNVIVDCGLRTQLGRREENVCDGNLYSRRGDACGFHVRFPEPENFENLAGWQEYFGLDPHSVQAAIEADFDTRGLVLTWKIDGNLPECQPLSLGDQEFPAAIPGPLTGSEGSLTFPIRDEAER